MTFIQTNKKFKTVTSRTSENRNTWWMRLRIFSTWEYYMRSSKKIKTFLIQYRVHTTYICIMIQPNVHIRTMSRGWFKNLHPIPSIKFTATFYPVFHHIFFKCSNARDSSQVSVHIRIAVVQLNVSQDIDVRRKNTFNTNN